MEWVALAVALVGAVVGPIVTWKIARRQRSGTIQTSEAADLWRESESLRKEYKDRADKLEAQLTEVNKKLAIMTKELNKLRTNSDTQLEKIKELKTIITKLREENRRLLSLKKGYAT